MVRGKWPVDWQSSMTMWPDPSSVYWQCQTPTLPSVVVFVQIHCYYKKNKCTFIVLYNLIREVNMHTIMQINSEVWNSCHTRELCVLDLIWHSHGQRNSWKWQCSSGLHILEGLQVQHLNKHLICFTFYLLKRQLLNIQHQF